MPLTSLGELDGKRVQFFCFFEDHISLQVLEVAVENVKRDSWAIAGDILNVGVFQNGVYSVVSDELSRNVIGQPLIGRSVHTHPVLPDNVVHFSAYIILKSSLIQGFEINVNGFLQNISYLVHPFLFVSAQTRFNYAVVHLLGVIIIENVHVRVGGIDGIGNI